MYDVLKIVCSAQIRCYSPTRYNISNIECTQGSLTTCIYVVAVLEYDPTYDFAHVYISTYADKAIQSRMIIRPGVPP